MGYTCVNRSMTADAAGKDAVDDDDVDGDRMTSCDLTAVTWQWVDGPGETRQNSPSISLVTFRLVQRSTITGKQGCSHVSKIGVPIPYKRPTTVLKGVEGRGMEKVCPIPMRLPGCLGSQTIFGAFHVQFYAISRIF